MNKSRTLYHCTTKKNARLILKGKFRTNFVYAWADLHLATGYADLTNKKKILFIDANKYEKIFIDGIFIYALVKSSDVLRVY